jgi:polysaccharide pyruvyl transferase WcaK-like protein
MKILHLASHIGNIGDNASHIGFRTILPEVVDEPYSVENLEIRKFYKHYGQSDKAFFNDDFAAFANKFDLLVIGGGGFLDFWVEGSETGTTINISDRVLRKLRVPLMIVSVGCIPHHEIPDGNVGRFKNFLDSLLARKNTLVAVRNDGSKGVLKEYFGARYEHAVPEVLDHGFYYKNDGRAYVPSGRPYILINTTLDQVNMVNMKTGRIDKAKYIDEMREVIKYLLDKTEYDLVFASHIYKDIQASQLLLEGIDDFAIRSRIVLTPYVQGDDGCNQIFSAYKNARLVIGMRFHANVCSIAMDVPSIGIAALDRVSSVYENLGLGDHVVPPGDNFSERVIEKIVSLETNYDSKHQVNLASRKNQCMDLYKKAYSNFR